MAPDYPKHEAPPPLTRISHHRPCTADRAEPGLADCGELSRVEPTRIGRSYQYLFIFQVTHFVKSSLVSRPWPANHDPNRTKLGLAAVNFF